MRAVAEEIAGAEAKLLEARRTEEQYRAFISENLNRAAECEKQGEHARAIPILQKALKRYPADPDLCAALNRVQATMERGERERELAAAAAGVKRDVDRGNWESALKRIDELNRTFSGHPELVSLQEQARTRRAREIKVFIDKARGCLAAGNLAEAEKILEKNLASFGDESAVAALAKDIKDERARASLIETARNNTAARRFDAAESIVNELAARRPNDPAAKELRASLEAAREQDRKEKLYRSGRAEGDQLLRNRQYAEAIAKFEYLLSQFPADKQLQQDLAGATAAEERARKAAAAGAAATATVPSSAVSPVKPVSAGQFPRGVLYGIGAVVLAAIAGFVFLRPHPAAAPLDLKPTELHFIYQRGVTAPAQTITASGPPEIADPTKSVHWLTVTRKGSRAGSAEFAILVAADKAPGTYSDDVVFTPEKRVHVVLDVIAPGVKPPPQIEPASLTFRFQPGGKMPDPQDIEVRNLADVPAPKKTARWITVTPAGAARFAVRVNPTGLPPRSYGEDLTFTDQLKLHVDLEVVPPLPSGTPPVMVDPTSLSFGYTRGDTVPPKEITVFGLPKGVSPGKKADWITITPGGSAAGKTKYVVHVAGNLDAGHHHDDLIFSPQTKVPVDVEVVAPAPVATKKAEPPPPPPPQEQPKPVTPDPPVDADIPEIGRVLWTGTLAPSETLTINRQTASHGSVNRRMPFGAIVIANPMPDKIQIVEQPTKANHYTLVLKNISSSPISQALTLRWSAGK